MADHFYVGETESVSQRLQQHRRRYTANAAVVTSSPPPTTTTTSATISGYYPAESMEAAAATVLQDSILQAPPSMPFMPSTSSIPLIHMLVIPMPNKSMASEVEQ